MAPRIDLNLEQQPDNYDGDTRVEAPEEGTTPEQHVNPEQRPGTTPLSANDNEDVIPFRTSKRLQGAIYRMIQQRDGNCLENGTPAIKGRNSGATPLPSRKVKKQQAKQPDSSPPEGMIDVKCETEDKTPPSVDIVKEVGCDSVKNVDSGNRKRKGFTVHFAEPVFAYTDDEKEAASKQLLLLSKRDSLRSHHTNEKIPVPCTPKRPTKADGSRHQSRAPPMYCFDLLCNHVGPRGWRCYRSIVEGKSYCRFHESRETLPFESGITQTVHN